MSVLLEEDRADLEQAKPLFFACDSFEGLPRHTKRDEHPYFPKHWKHLKFEMSQQEFEKKLASRNVSGDDVIIVKGLVRRNSYR